MELNNVFLVVVIFVLAKRTSIVRYCRGLISFRPMHPRLLLLLFKNGLQRTF